MRLSNEYKTIITRTLSKYFGENAKFYLFGSRTDDNKRGGDIDLYIESNCEDFSSCWQAKSKAHIELMELLGEQKIDILVHVKGRKYSAIENIARKTGIIL